MKLNTLLIQKRLDKMERRHAWLASKVGVTRPCVHWWMIGKQMPTLRHIQLIADILGVEWTKLVKK